MMLDFMDGIKTSLKHLHLAEKIQLFSESIAFGGNEKEVYEKTEKLLILEDVDILIAYIDLKVQEILKPLVYTSGKLMLFVNPGANHPQNWVPQPNVLNLTLQHSFLCWLTGKLAAEKKGNAALASSFYDCGYWHTASMVKGLAQPDSKISFNYINNQRYDDSFEITQLTDYLSVNKDTHMLLCVFDSLPGSLFYSRLHSFEEAHTLQLFVSPMMIEPEALSQNGEGFRFHINGYLPWHPSLENNANLDFTNILLQQTKRPANIFSLLGWETGLIINEIFLRCDKQYGDGSVIISKLAKEKIISPRGELILDQDTNYFISPVGKCSIKPNSEKADITWIKDTQEKWTEFTQEKYEGVSSGWTNTYLCY